MVGVSCSNGDNPDGPDVPVTPVGQTVFMFFPWSNSLLSDFRRTVEDMQTVVAQRSMKDERVMVFMATSEREAVLFELKKQNGRCLTDTLRRYSDRPFTSRQWLTSLFSEVMTLAPPRATAWWWDATDWHGYPYKDNETHGKDLAHKKR